MARITHGDVGDNWVPQATFTVGGTPTDPTNVTVKIRDAAGTITTLGPVAGATGGGGIVRVSVGVFNTVIPITAAGYWYTNFTGTGTAAASEDHEFRADPTGFTANWGLSTRALVGLGETKDWLQSQNIDTGEDLDLVRVINDISDRFHHEAEREFKVNGTNPQTRSVDVDNLGTYGIVHVGDMTSVTTVEVLDSNWSTVVETVAAADYALLPLVRQSWEPIQRIQLNYRNGVGALRGGYRVRVTGSWGFPAIPGDVRQAVLDAVAAIVDRNVEHYSQDLGFAAAQGQNASGGGTVVMIGGGRQRLLTLPPAAIAVAWRYRHPLVG